MATEKQGSLLKRWDLMGKNDLSDEWYAIAYNVEQTLLNAGAEPGKDYSYLDLMNLAQPFVLEMFKDEDRRIEYTYPADRMA